MCVQGRKRWIIKFFPRCLRKNMKEPTYILKNKTNAEHQILDEVVYLIKTRAWIDESDGLPIHPHTHTYTYNHTKLYIHIHTHVHTNTHTHTYTHTHIYTTTHLHIYTHTYIHTHTQTYTDSKCNFVRSRTLECIRRHVVFFKASH